MIESKAVRSAWVALVFCALGSVSNTGCNAIISEREQRNKREKEEASVPMRQLTEASTHREQTTLKV